MVLAIYLVHEPVLEFAPIIERPMTAYVENAADARFLSHSLAVTMVLPVAIVAHRAIEVPGRRILRAQS